MSDTSLFLTGMATVVAVVAAARGTWSPCGTSMLSSITPLAEHGRGHRFGPTAAWFVVGALAGGLTLGLVVGALAAGVRAAPLPAPAQLALGCAAAVVAAASDAAVAGFHLPIHRRQVNERWLDRFRPWVYGAGFGWQIGAGLVTYVKTAAVYLMIGLLALGGTPWGALGVCGLFGLVRGVSVFLGRSITSFEALARVHRRLAELDGPSVAVVVVVEVTAGAGCAALLAPWLAAVVVLGAGVLSLRRARGRVAHRLHGLAAPGRARSG